MTPVSGVGTPGEARLARIANRGNPSRLTATEAAMAKGQVKSNKEKRKPKQDKGDKKKK